MNTIICTVTTFLKELINKKLIIIFSLFFNLFIFSYGYGQLNANRVNIKEIYDSHLERYLLPEIKGADEIISFVEIPSFEPESVIRVIKKDDNYVIEGRYFKENQWEKIFSLFKGTRIIIPEPKMIFYSVSISNSFANKMQITFSDVIMKMKYHMHADTDGSSFILRLRTDKTIISRNISNPREADIEYNLIRNCSQIVSDVKNNSFNELKFKDSFN